MLRIFVLLSMFMLLAASHAFAGHHHGRKCPQCHKTCHVTVEPIKIKKECWDVECEEICIPAITFPWEKCTTPKCGRVISVKKLKIHTYECDGCGYKWKIDQKPCGSCHEEVLPPPPVPAPEIPAPQSARRSSWLPSWPWSR